MKTRLKELRAKLELTQEQLADKVSVRRETISLLEKWAYNPSLLLAIKIATVFWETIEDIFIFDADELE